MNLTKLMLVGLLFAIPMMVNAAVQKKNVATKTLASRIKKGSFDSAVKRASQAKAYAKQEQMTPILEINAKIQQKEQELKRLTQEIGLLKVQSVKLQAETSNQELNNRQRSIDQIDQDEQKNLERQARTRA